MIRTGGTGHSMLVGLDQENLSAGRTGEFSPFSDRFLPLFFDNTFSQLTICENGKCPERDRI
jgi:hypothetical protein